MTSRSKAQWIMDHLLGIANQGHIFDNDVWKIIT